MSSFVPRSLRLAAFLAALLVPALALAAGGGEHHAGIDGKRLAFQIANLGILVFILAKFGGGAINRALKARHDQLKADLEDAARARDAAEAKLKSQEKRLGNLEQELAALRASIKDEAEREKARMVAAAEEKARRIQDETKFLLDQQVKEAELRLRGEIAAAALEVAEQKVRAALGAEDEARLFGGFVSEMDRPTGGAPRRAS